MKSSFALTTKGQVTIPKSVRDHLGLQPGSRAVFRIKKSGEVVIGRPLTPAEIMAKVGKPTGNQPLTEREKLRAEYLAKKYNVKL